MEGFSISASGLASRESASLRNSAATFPAVVVLIASPSLSLRLWPLVLGSGEMRGLRLHGPSLHRAERSPCDSHRDNASGIRSRAGPSVFLQGHLSHTAYSLRQSSNDRLSMCHLRRERRRYTIHSTRRC